jgi:hypothetical protein
MTSESSEGSLFQEDSSESSAGNGMRNSNLRTTTWAPATRGESWAKKKSNSQLHLGSVALNHGSSDAQATAQVSPLSPPPQSFTKAQRTINPAPPPPSWPIRRTTTGGTRSQITTPKKEEKLITTKEAD